MKTSLIRVLVVCFALQLRSHKPEIKAIKRHVFVLPLGPSFFIGAFTAVS